MKLWLGVVVVSLVTACGGGGGDSAGASASGSAAPLLVGDGTASAAAALPNAAVKRAQPADVDNGLLLTRLSVVLTRDATVSQFNTAAADAGATGFAYARTGSPFVTLEVPRQADGAALAAAAARMRTHAGILTAVPGRQLQQRELPPPGDVDKVDPIDLDHLLVTGFPAAWNARKLVTDNCAGHSVTVIVPDLYDTPAPAGFADQVPGALENFDEVPLPSGNTHGFDVIAILAGAFDVSPPTGANPFPQCLKIVPVDVSGVDALQAVAIIGQAIEREGSKSIVNLSVGFTTRYCGPNRSSACAAADLASDTQVLELKEEIAFRFASGIAWAEFAMQPDFLDNTMLTVAAGNERIDTPDVGALGEVYAGFRSARLASSQPLAAQLSSLRSTLADPALWQATGFPTLTLDQPTIDSLQQTLDALPTHPVPSDRNLTVVGSTTTSEVLDQLQASASSNEGADLFAVGEDITGLGHQILKGTSFAAPQVAGLASYLWLLDDDLRSQPVAQTLQLIRAASRNNGHVAGIIDAYGSMLALDARRHVVAIRKALLDVNGDGQFDHLDLQKFVEAYATDPQTRDYSRFDLNGDGATGGIGIGRFDLEANGLDANSAARFGTADATIEGYHITMNSAAASDLQILCYYAYIADANGAPLVYSNGADALAERTRLLGPDKCVGARINAQLPAQVSSATTLSATVQVPTGQGQFAPAPNLLVQLVPTCASVTPTTATTAADGSITATVTPNAGCATVSVALTARADANSNPLARQTVSATVAGASFVISMQAEGRVGFSTYALSPSRQSQATVQRVMPDGSVVGCGNGGVATCIAHWTATGGTIIDGRPDGSSVGSLGTYTAGTVMGRFSITATSPTAEFPTITAAIIIGPLGTYSVHSCSFTDDESAATCVDSSAPKFDFIEFFDATGDGRYEMADTTLLTGVAPVVFDLVNGVPSNFKALITCNFASPPGCVSGPSDLVGLSITEVSVDPTSMRFLATAFQASTGNLIQRHRVTLTRIP